MAALARVVYLEPQACTQRAPFSTILDTMCTPFCARGSQLELSFLLNNKTSEGQCSCDTHSVPTQHPLNTHSIPTQYPLVNTVVWRNYQKAIYGPKSLIARVPIFTSGYWVGIEWVSSGY